MGARLLEWGARGRAVRRRAAIISHPRLWAGIDPAFRRLSRPQQIAFWRWGNGQPASNEFGREIEGNGGDEEQKGFEVVARWLGYPGAQSKVVRRRRSCKAESHRLYEVLFG